MVAPHLIVFVDCNYYNFDVEYYCDLDNFDNHLWIDIVINQLLVNNLQIEDFLVYRIIAMIDSFLYFLVAYYSQSSSQFGLKTYYFWREGVERNCFSFDF
jgi:hypothetical protein